MHVDVARTLCWHSNGSNKLPSCNQEHLKALLPMSIIPVIRRSPFMASTPRMCLKAFLLCQHKFICACGWVEDILDTVDIRLRAVPAKKRCPAALYHTVLPAKDRHHSHISTVLKTCSMFWWGPTAQCRMEDLPEFVVLGCLSWSTVCPIFTVLINKRTWSPLIYRIIVKIMVGSIGCLHKWNIAFLLAYSLSGVLPSRFSSKRKSYF